MEIYYNSIAIQKYEAIVVNKEQTQRAGKIRERGFVKVGKSRAYLYCK